jgi:hypothetical protein
MWMKLAKTIALAALLITLGAAYLAWSRRQWPDDHGARDRLLARLSAGTGVLDMAEITSFPWTRLEIFGPYTDKESAERRLGFPWPYKWSAVEAQDDRVFLVFVDSTRVAAAFEFPRVLDVSRHSIDRQSARFIVEARGDARRLIHPAEPEFESDFWPGEGIPVIAPTGDTLLLYSSPRSGLEPMVRRPTNPDERIRFDSSRYQTMAAAGATFSGDTLRGVSYGRIRHLRRDAAGRETTFTNLAKLTPMLLQPRSEGECLIRLGELVVGARCPDGPSQPPQTEWWVWTPGPNGAGWLRVGEQTSVVGRKF